MTKIEIWEKDSDINDLENECIYCKAIPERIIERIDDGNIIWICKKCFCENSSYNPLKIEIDITGFYCKYCENNKHTCLSFNKDNQLEFKCSKCKRRWI